MDINFDKINETYSHIKSTNKSYQTFLSAY